MNPMMLGGLAMAALLLLVLLVAMRPWWRGGARATQERSAANVAAFRLRLDELEAEAASGLIPPDEAVSLRGELEARLLADAGDAPARLVMTGGRRPLAALLAAVFVVLFAAGGYYASGSWRLQQQIADADAAKPTFDPKIVAMVDQLAGRLRAKPDDVQGWGMLGRAYFVMQRYAESAQAYAEVNTRSPSAESLTDEGEALAWAQGGEVTGEAAEKMEAALKFDPAFAKALWYGGLASAQAGRFPQARERWQALLKRDDLPDDMRNALDERMKVLASVEAEAGAATAAPAVAIAPSAPLKLHVSLAPGLAAKLPAGATLFVFAKALSGPQMPLAVQRIAGPTLPLDDSMAMAPALRLSQFERVAVTARLSAAGAAQAASGDLEGRIETGRAKDGDPVLNLVIDRMLP
jgi:cytochrome c-type biogenesis protein CcmH